MTVFSDIPISTPFNCSTVVIPLAGEASTKNSGTSGKTRRAVVTIRIFSSLPALISTVVRSSLSPPSIPPACISESRSAPLATGTSSTSIPSAA